jgi:protein-tyrosine phosphatase
MKQVYDNLYIGDVADADNPKKHRQENIEYILNVSGSGPNRDSAPGYETVKNNTYIHIPIADDGTNPDFLIQTVIETAEKLYNQAVEEEKSLIIHCAAGMSRSPAIASALMSLENKRVVRENISRIKKVKSGVSPHDELVSQVSRLTADIHNL